MTTPLTLKLTLNGEEWTQEVKEGEPVLIQTPRGTITATVTVPDSGLMNKVASLAGTLLNIATVAGTISSLYFLKTNPVVTVLVAGGANIIVRGITRSMISSLSSTTTQLVLLLLIGIPAVMIAKSSQT